MSRSKLHAVVYDIPSPQPLMGKARTVRCHAEIYDYSNYIGFSFEVQGKNVKKSGEKSKEKSSIFVKNTNRPEKCDFLGNLHNDSSKLYKLPYKPKGEGFRFCESLRLTGRLYRGKIAASFQKHS